MFRHFHYLDTSLNKTAECYIGMWENEPVCFQAVLPMPGKIPPLFKGDTRLKYRGHRLVVLPDFQGMGIGTRFSNAIGEMYLNRDSRYFSRTAHIRMGEYREHSDLWRATDSNLKKAVENKIRTWHNYHRDVTRICYSHEYIGSKENKYRKLYEESLK
jgi:GNAT superfamily N-acetyltransferase